MTPRIGLEGAIVSEFDPVVLTQRRLLKDLPSEVAARLHLYMICWRPRITVVPETWEFTEDVVRARFELDLGGDVGEISFELTNVWQRTDLEVRASHPFLFFQLCERGGDVIFEQHAGWWLAQMAHTSETPDFPQWIFDLEVLYVGQSYGIDGQRNAAERLATHERLIDVYETALERASHQEVWLLLLGLQPTIQAVELMPTGPPWPSEDDLGNEFERLITATIPEVQRVAFTEAALIRYFDPPLNHDFRTTFPSALHKTYTECYDLDLNSVGIGLDTTGVFARTFSRSVAPAYLHAASFPLHNPAERKAMFSFAAPPTGQDGVGNSDDSADPAD